MTDRQRIVHLLDQTLSSDGDVVRGATELLDRLSLALDFPFSLLTIVAGPENHGVRVAAATYLKNLLRRSFYGESQPESLGQEFRDQLVRALLHVDPPVLKVLVEAFRVVVDIEFVKKNAWSELVPVLKHAIQQSNYMSGHGHSELKTINALAILQALVRPFQYFLNPKVAKEPVPVQLELIANEILVPLLAVFHGFIEKESAVYTVDLELEKILLIICKSMYYTVRSYMPSTLVPLLPSFCHDLYAILDSLSLERMVSPDNTWEIRLKTGKRSLLIFCNLITRHRKHSDRLMPDIVKRVLSIVKYCKDINLSSLSERVVSLSYDVISHVLETGPGWRLMSPYFSVLLDSSILPALMLHEKDVAEWEEDADEFVRKNFPSDLEEVSGWRDDLFTARKSALNLLGVISMSKGPPMASTHGAVASSKRKKGDKNRGKNQRSSMGELLVIPFLSKFSIPCDANASDLSSMQNYFGVLMGYGGLQDFLREQKPEYTTALIQNRVLPIYQVSFFFPYLVAAANWIIGELAPCLPEDMSSNVYSALLKALNMPTRDISCYPVRATSAGAIAALLDVTPPTFPVQLITLCLGEFFAIVYRSCFASFFYSFQVVLQSDYKPPDWFPLLQVIIGRIGVGDEETSMLYELLISVVEAGDENVAIHIPLVMPSLVGVMLKCIPADDEPWPQMVVRGFAALAVMAKSWEDAEPEETEREDISRDWAYGRATISRALSLLLQQAWLIPMSTMNADGPSCPSCVDDASTLLWFMIRSVTSDKTIVELNLSALLVAWASFIANWHAWEEQEDLAIFYCIKEIIILQNNYHLDNFFKQRIPSPPAPPVPKQSIIEGISAFISEAILQYPCAMRRACSCIHILLHGLRYPVDMEEVKQSLVLCFGQAAIAQFRGSRRKPPSSWKPLLYAVASCYICYPDVVERALVKNEECGLVAWASALNSVVSSISETSGSADAEIKLIVITLAKVVEQLLQKDVMFYGLSRQCFISLLKACIRMKEIQKDGDEEYEEEEYEEDEDEETDEDEDSEEEMHEETEEEFFERYAKAAADLENESVVEEGDIEDGEGIEPGFLEEIDDQSTMRYILERYLQILVQGEPPLSPQLILRLLECFPEYSVFFNA